MYTPIQAAKVFREIKNALLSKPLLFTREGVFRISGSQAQARELVEGILSGTKVKTPSDRNLEKFPLHDYISALKLVLDECTLLNPESLSIEMLKDSIEKYDPAQAAYELSLYIDQLAKSTDENEHAAGEVFYSYLQLTKQAVIFQEKNKMSAQNLGIVLGPNFEKMMNSDPKRTLSLILKLNTVCELMLKNDAFTNDFEKMYATSIITAREKQLQKLESEKESLQYLRQTYQAKISEYQQKIAAQKVALSEASNRSNKKMIAAKIEEFEKIIELYKKDDKEETAVKIKAIKSQISDLKEDIKSLKSKHLQHVKPSVFKDSQELKITQIIDEIKELITDDEEDVNASPFPINLLMKATVKPKPHNDKELNKHVKQSNQSSNKAIVKIKPTI